MLRQAAHNKLSSHASCSLSKGQHHAVGSSPKIAKFAKRKIGTKSRIFNFLKKKERYSTKVLIKGFLVIPHMLGYVASFMHFLPLLKTHLKSVLARKELSNFRITQNLKDVASCLTVKDESTWFP